MFKKFTSQDITSSLFICPYFYILKIFRKKYGQVFTNQDCSQVYRPNTLELKLAAYLQVKEFASLQTDGFVS
jgi:hypothetical protein